mmetsp:Transcript_47210/g.111313  ORF Transcript_47210/g.111313 Transcript_47210/m.111313 type:complete len:971 (-) Transcript_47210:106-3018(-)
MASSTYFKDQRGRGENAELQEELASNDKTKKRDAVKKVIRDMTLGKDVSGLFAPVVNNMMTPNLEVRKLVYLYLINYAKTQPDLAIMAVNGFVKDCGDANPLIRALAVRTMGCIRVEQISEYLCEPLRRALKDADPYVRKTAAICVCKLYEISPDLVIDQGFIDSLNDLLGDSNPMVVSNAVAALAEIQHHGATKALTLNNTTILKLLAVLNECSEWGQIFILDVVSTYTPPNAAEADNILDRVKPRLQHANSAVVLSTAKVMLKLLDIITDNDKIKTFVKALGPPLVTLMSSESEIQYVALRNIQLICQIRPTVLHGDVKVFFCKYNDPIFVKMEKLDVLVMLASDRNIDQVLMEFKEYATEIDDEFVCKAVRCIGRCAIKLTDAAEKCVKVLVDLIETKVNYVVQEAIIVIRDIFRKYPNKYESVIGTLCENLDTLDNHEAKSSMIWVIGEYADRIDNAAELLGQFLDTFMEETHPVQLQLLTSTVKLFLKRPTTAQDMVKKVLALATQSTDHPDLRDRGYIYWRLLSTDPEGAKTVVLADKPTIEDDTNQTEPALLNDLISQLSNLASVYHKRPQQFVDRKKVAADGDDFEEADEPERAGGGGEYVEEEATTVPDTPAPVIDMLSLDDPVPAPSGGGGSSGLDDLLSMDSKPAAPAKPSGGGGDLLDLMGGGAPAPKAPAASAPSTAGMDNSLPEILGTVAGKGMIMRGKVVNEGGSLKYKLSVANNTQGPLSGFALQINKNSFGLASVAGLLEGSTIMPGQSQSTALPLVVQQDRVDVKPLPNTSGGAAIQVAVKNSQAVCYFNDEVPLPAILEQGFSLPQGDYLSQWQSMAADKQNIREVTGIPTGNVDAIDNCLKSAGLCLVARRVMQPAGTTALYMGGKSVAGQPMLMEAQVSAAAVRVTARSPVPNLAAVFAITVERHLKASLGGAAAAAPAANIPTMMAAAPAPAPAAPSSGGNVDLLGLF